MEIEVTVITDVYSVPDKKGVSKILKRGVKFRQTVNTDDIKHVREYVSNTGKTNPKRSLLILKEGDEKYLTIDKAYNELKLIKITNKINGFRR